MKLARRGLMAAGAGMLLPNHGWADRAALEAGARREGSVTWYIAQMTGEAAEAMGKRFTQRFPGVNVTAIRTTGQVAYERLSQELKNSTLQCDVFSSTDIAHYPALRARGALAKYDAENAAALAPAYQGQGEDGFYYPTSASLQIMVYHTKNVKTGEQPLRCTDLLDPKWKGRVGIAHPAFSGYFGQWVLAMRKQYGWEFFEKLAKNNPRIGRSGNDPISLLNAGECLIGTGPVSTAIQNMEKGNPIGFVYPEDGTVLTVGCSAVVEKAPHPFAARLFQEWLLSLDYAEACKDWHLEPVRADAPRMSGTKSLAELKLLRLTTAEIAKGIPEAVEQWRDTFGN